MPIPARARVIVAGFDRVCVWRVWIEPAIRHSGWAAPGRNSRAVSIDLDGDLTHPIPILRIVGPGSAGGFGTARRRVSALIKRYGPGEIDLRRVSRCRAVECGIQGRQVVYENVIVPAVVSSVLEQTA